MRLWARSLRGRVTIIATVVAALVLTPVAIAGVLITRHLIAQATWDSTGDTAARIAARVRGGELGAGHGLPVLDSDVDLIQLVAHDGRILAASDAARKLPMLSGVRPRPGGRDVDVTACLPAMCMHITVMRAGLTAEAPIVYAARRTPPLLSTRSMEISAAVQLAAILALTAWATWVVTGSALRPVARMRRELDHITARDLSRRVTEPPGDDEVAQLARSVNGTLARLERAGLQQRQFAADASHELRTPIAGLRAQLESAQLYPDEADVRTLVKSALRDTARLEAIITDLLLLARIGSGEDAAAREQVDLAELVRQELARRTDRVPVRTELAEGVTVHGVRLQLARVLTNLLDNAQRHAEKQVSVEVRRQDGQAVLCVENDGAPIAVGDRKRIFERFTRLDAARSRDAGGTGLGLAIARDVALAHGGQIRVEDSPHGARFVLRLPATWPG
ncbi:sensor histidine kinase [Nonomuraea harbinensis]|uniref:histidine kinase n=1 Tax=Nonomuraea harbinensis TaxID=1286938 RepID=A0ABW1BYA8_9ACTN|nr:ATP-binding protein [Nonomuraea harbinensis]